jgi:hypothetical protein
VSNPPPPPSMLHKVTAKGHYIIDPVSLRQVRRFPTIQQPLHDRAGNRRFPLVFPSIHGGRGLDVHDSHLGMVVSKQRYT